MTHEKIKCLFNSSVQSVCSSISDFAIRPGLDFTRHRKIAPDDLIRFLVSEGSSSTRNELLDFFGMDCRAPSAPALCQQRAKLLPDALYAVFTGFRDSVDACSPPPPYRFLAADGSTATFYSRPGFSPPEYFVEPAHSADGFHSIHINAFFDLARHTYTDALLQPVHQKDEFRAFCTIVDRHPVLKGSCNVYVGDRGYCSYNNMAHVIHTGQFFIFRTKDIHQKGLVGKFDYPESPTFDLRVDVSLVRSNSAKTKAGKGYRRFIDKATSFDFLDYGSLDSFDISFRVVRLKISGVGYECLVTNLPQDVFPPERLKIIYNARWGIESSFRKLKYTIGLSSFHSIKSMFVQQEIWARLIAYNVTETLIRQTVIPKKVRKHPCVVNFSVAAHICRAFLRLSAGKGPLDVMALLERQLIPIRDERQFDRLQTAHFRKPKYFIYRAS